MHNFKKQFIVKDLERSLKKYLKGGKFDNVSAITSKTMAAIKGKNNRTTELSFKMFLVRNSIKGFKTNVKDLPGKPDFYFPNGRIAIFIDGCFWHGCPQCGHIPKTRSDFWLTKFNRNRERDQRNNATLKSMRINPVRIWEHELKDLNGLNHILSILS